MSLLKYYLVAIPSGFLMAPGWIAGLVFHRLADGFRAARFSLDQLDDKCIDFLKSRK